MNLGSFNANEVPPEQGGSKHPVGMYPFRITNTDIVSTKDETGGMLTVEFTSPVGTIINRYNLFLPKSPQAVEIARKQLSALCHAVGIFQVNFDNKARELVGGQGSMEVGWQKGDEPSAEKPQGGYVEVKKVFDSNGNEPGKAPSQPQTQQAQNFNQQPQQATPMQQQPGGGWGNAAPAAPAQPAQQPQGWGNAQPQQTAQPGPNPPAGGFTPAAGNAAPPPPWGNRG